MIVNNIRNVILKNDALPMSIDINCVPLTNVHDERKPIKPILDINIKLDNEVNAESPSFNPRGGADSYNIKPRMAQNTDSLNTKIKVGTV